MIKPIIKFPAPWLQLKCCAITFPITPKMSDHISDLKDTLANTPNGIALASNQILTEGYRVFVVRPGSCDLPEVVINPTWSAIGFGDRVPHDEGCLSIPEYRSFTLRTESVLLLGLTEDGGFIDREFKGLAAQIIQHECDHLDGRTILDYADKKTRFQVRAEAIKNRKMGR
jgi:peptide deformylase